MITINSERGWQRIKTWDDVISTPGYTDTVNPNQVELDKPIGRYIEPEEKICGLTTCHRRHNRGYLISIKGGAITNIGKDCGRTHFGVEFESMARLMDREIELQDRREGLQAAQSQVPGFQEAAELMMFDERGARWANKAMTALNRANPSETIARELLHAQRTQRPEIELSRPATKEEVDLMVASERISKAEAAKPQHITETIGTLGGLQALSVWPELRAILVEDLRPKLERLAGLALGELTGPELNHWAKWASEVPQKLDRAQTVLTYCRAFLQADNLLQLEKLEPEPEIRREYRRFIKASI